MGGRCQADWMHAVPKVPSATERVSFTWRWTSRTGQPDSSEGYGAAQLRRQLPGRATTASALMGKDVRMSHSIDAAELADALDVIAIGRLQARYGDIVSRQAWGELDDIFLRSESTRLNSSH